MLNQSALRAVFEESVKLKPNEKCLIIADTITKDLANDFYEYSKNIADTKFHVISPTGENGAEPDQSTADMMKEYDVIFLIVKYSLSHTKARRDAKNARIVSMPNPNEEMLNRTLDIDYDELYELNSNIRKAIIGKKIRVTTKLGTDITFDLTTVCGENGGYRDKVGIWGNLPAGEVDSGIKNAEGTLVFDGSFPQVIIKEPIKARVKDNRAEVFDDNLKKKLDKVGKDAYYLAEFGIGTNPKAIITGNVLEDEKVLGTCHFAFGNDLSYGGNNDVPIHIDGIIRNPTIIADGKVIMEEGKFCI